MISLLRYLTKTEKTAKSIDEAKALALAELGIEESEAEITVLEEASKGFLGIVRKDAKVAVEAKDTNAVVAKTFLSQLFSSMGLDVDVAAKSDDETLNVDMSGEHMGVIIGKRGDTLDALQYLTSLVVNHESEERVRVILDTENYREKRHDALIALANRLADKVEKSGRKYTLEPMNPYERRIIHSSLQSNDAKTTFSVGEDPYRKIVIAPKNVSRPHFTHKPSEYRQHNYNKHKNFDEFLSENSTEE